MLSYIWLTLAIVVVVFIPILVISRLKKKPSYPISDHYNGKYFYNPAGESRSGRDILSWLASRKKPRWPASVAIKKFTPPGKAQDGEIRITYINHSTFLIQVGKLAILVDPIWSNRCSPFAWIGPKRVIAPGQPKEDIPKIDLILISHNHYDHLDKATIQYFETRDRPQVITGLGNRPLLNSFGCRKVQEVDWWETKICKKTAIHFVPAKHFSSRYLWDKDATLWGGFAIETSKGIIYFAGDTAYGDHFKKIRRKFGKPAFALLPIGAYEPRWFMKPAHMNPTEAVEAHLDLQATTSIACHYGTFQLADERYYAPLQQLHSAMKKKKVAKEAFIHLLAGETTRKL